MSENIKQIQGIKRAYEPNPSANNAGYQPVAKKKKGTYTSHALFNQPFLSFFSYARCTGCRYNIAGDDPYKY